MARTTNRIYWQILGAGVAGLIVFTVLVISLPKHRPTQPADEPIPTASDALNSMTAYKKKSGVEGYKELKKEVASTIKYSIKDNNRFAYVEVTHYSDAVKLEVLYILHAKGYTVKVISGSINPEKTYWEIGW